MKGLETPNKAAALSRAKLLERRLRDVPWEKLKPTLPGKRAVLADVEELYQALNKERTRPLRLNTVRQNLYCLKMIATRLKVETVDDLAEKIVDFPRLPSVENLSRRSIASLARQASSVFSDAAIAYYRTHGLNINETPFKKGIPYAPPAEPFRGYPMEFISKLFATARVELSKKEPGMWAAFLLCLCAGLRQQEAAWLHKEDLLEDCVLVTSRDEHETKSGRHRSIRLPAKLLKDLRAIPSASQYVIPDGRTIGQATPKNRANITFRCLSSWLRRHGLIVQKPVHELRKIYGAIVTTNHGLYAASVLLGHSSVKVTEAHYAALLNPPTVDIEQQTKPVMMPQTHLEALPDYIDLSQVTTAGEARDNGPKAKKTHLLIK